MKYIQHDTAESHIDEEIHGSKFLSFDLIPPKTEHTPSFHVYNFEFVQTFYFIFKTIPFNNKSVYK